MIGRMCKHKRWHTLRLDGRSCKIDRQASVKSFNDANNQEALVFLLFSKAGGCGLNLIGTSRLVMIDPDWNPANDLQVMARTWRKGPLRNCVTYRVLSTGTVEETIHQRQLSKRDCGSQGPRDQSRARATLTKLRAITCIPTRGKH
jgi:DNA repair and recombination RAD54-like protein